jgi:SNF2 family DNA or RNA helicase
MHSQIGHLVVVLKGSQKKRLELFRKMKDQRPFPIFVTNYEAMQMKELVQEFLNHKFEVGVFDESQRLKNHTAVRTKMATLIAKGTAHNYILSGSPILNTPMDIFAQYRILDRGETFGTSFMEFRARYFFDHNAGMPSHKYFPDFELRDSKIDEINEKIYQKAMRVMKSECLDLPDLVRQQVYVDLSLEQQRIYDEMKHNFLAFLDSETCTAQLAIVKALRLQQIVSGYIKLDTGDEVRLRDNYRLDALEDILEDIPPTEKVIIWSTFRENYTQIARLLQKLKWDYTELHGEVASKDRQPNIDRFQNDPKCRAIICNQQAGGIGVNLTAAAYSIYYSRNFSLEQDLQSEARNHRGGSEIHKKITRIDLVARDTIDEIILESLRNKFDLAERILELRNKLR